MQKNFHQGYRMLCLQVACWSFLVFFLPILIPLIAATFFPGMLSWSIASIVFCWVIQCLFLVAIIQQREYLVQKASSWLLIFLRAQIRWVLLLCNLCAHGLWIWMSIVLFDYCDRWSVATVVQWFLLAAFTWSLCGVAVPMSARRYWGWFRRPQELKEEWKQVSATSN